MKFLRNFFIALLSLYVVFWAGLAIYFSYVDRNKSSFEVQLSRYFNRPVTIDVLQTSWQGLSPQIKIEGFYVEGHDELGPPLAFESLTATLNPWSILRFWPKFSEFSVHQPVLEIASLNANQISVAGIVLSFEGTSSPIRPKTVVRWLLDQYNTMWSDGTIIWRRQNGEYIEYKEIAFTFDRNKQSRSIVAGFRGVDGAVNFKAQSQGDLLSDRDWGASLEVIDGDGNAFVAQDDFSLKVADGQGALKLQRLNVQTIQDFIALSGLAKRVSWLSQANVSGYLHNMTLGFSGSLFAVKDWELAAKASGIGFESTGDGPQINNLAGQVSASTQGGEFLFSTQGSVFEWQDWFELPFKIDTASGDFSWRVKANGGVDVLLNDGQFDDGITRLSSVKLTSSIDPSARNINNLGDLFTVESISELDFEDQKIVKPDVKKVTPLSIDASAEFEMRDVVNFKYYLPKVKKIALFRKWLESAFSKGEMTNGRVSYQGLLSSQAITNGQAFLDLHADFADAVIDYGPSQSWPVVERGNGKLKIRNDVLTIASDDAYLGGDKVRDFKLRLPRLFEKNLELSVQGKVTKSLEKVLDFIFKGPLIAKDKKPTVLPVRAGQGEAELDLSVVVPLKNVNSTRVKGSAHIKRAVAYLPGDVPISIDSAVIDFTEKSINSEQLKAKFLGGDVVGDIVTVKQAQPPVFQVNAKGVAMLDHLKPWLGGQILSLMSGAASWQGSLLVDGNDLRLNTISDLNGIVIKAPAPMGKAQQERRKLSLAMSFGGSSTLSLNYNDVVGVDMSAKQPSGSLFDRSLIRVGNDGEQFEKISPATLSDGVNLEVSRDNINIDQCISGIIELAGYEPVDALGATPVPANSSFVDALRSIKVNAQDPVLLGQAIGDIGLSLTSEDGVRWGGSIDGPNIAGSMQFNFSENDYRFDLSSLALNNPLEKTGELPEIDYSLSSSSYPSVSLFVEDFQSNDKKLGQLKFIGAPEGDAWVLNEFEMQRNGVETSGSGRWLNSETLGSLTSFDFKTTIEEADEALDDFSLGGFIKKGSGSIVGSLNWIGAPHEFEYARLNGEFDLRLVDGELLKVEPGGGKIVGLLNFNAVARRLAFDFRDVFADGLTFDRMQYTGLFSDGKAVMRDAYIFTPAVFVRMEGQVDIANEMIDMEIHMSPELGGNLALLSALANPAAGAVVFLTQRVFKNQIRDVNFTSYRALGSWDEFEVVPFDDDEILSTNPESASKPIAGSDDTETENKQP